MTSTTTPRHPAAESDAPGYFQPFTDLRPAALRTSEGGEVVTHAHTVNPLGAHLHNVSGFGHTHAHTIIGPDHSHGRIPAGLTLGATEAIGHRFGEAANEPAHHCAGILSPECMTDAEFVAAMEAARKNWNEAIDALLDAHAPGWREERARQQAEAA